MLFLFLFTLALIIANIYFFKKKKYLYLFIPCMLYLPKYYGIEISGSLPIITVARIMYVVFYVYAFINRKRNINIKGFNIKALPREYYLLGGYFALRIISNMFYITTYSAAIKTIFEIVFEQFLFMVAIVLLSPTREEFDILSKVVVYTSVVFFILGIVESFTFVRPFDALYTVSRYMLNDHYIRLGLMRSTVTMGLPGFFGNACVLVFPLILYMYSNTKQLRYILFIPCCILAIIHSGCRSDIIFFAVITVFYVIFKIYKHFEVKELFKNILIIFAVTISAILVLSIFSSSLKNYYLGMLDSSLKAIGIETEGSSLLHSYEENVDFGSNTHAVASRTFQFSGIPYTLKINPLFGLGSGALESGKVYYYEFNAWRVYYTFDVGLVEIIVSEGLLGLIGHILLVLFLGNTILKRFGFIMSGTDKYCLFFLWPLTYYISTLSTTNMYSFLFLIVGYFMFISDYEKETVHKEI